ncbi:HAD family hydrolase [Saliphagus infecundisoli]|uniref:HAD family hydrolase n=1 Tax=Saliphagus infecundisoli TaxID=1849069 RepID=A0ABD5QC93_9EURY|nr:HAD family hydrolase [Saliphagus infecundisoli]
MTVPSSRSRYDTVIFDLDRTLVEHDQDGADLFADACATVGVEPFCEPELLELAGDIVRDESLTAREYEQRVFETVAAATGAEVNASELVQAYNEALDNQAVSLRSGAQTALDAVRNHSTAIVTNGPAETHVDKISATGLAASVDTIVYGTDVAQVKPAREPFELALDRLESNTDAVLKVGDSLHKDVKGGIELGIDTAWIPDERHREATGIEPTYTLSSLAELPEILSD